MRKFFVKRGAAVVAAPWDVVARCSRCLRLGDEPRLAVGSRRRYMVCGCVGRGCPVVANAAPNRSVESHSCLYVVLWWG